MEIKTCCTWEQDSFYSSELYNTECGEWFILTEGTPEENNMSFCAYCGRALVMVLAEEEEEEDKL